jgi:ubiquinone/menaquinone biosynthesis C-methylase UbiE
LKVTSPQRWRHPPFGNYLNSDWRMRGAYGDCGGVEEAFLAAIDTSLQPRSPDMLFDVVGDMQLSQAARVLDLGCGDGKYAIELARRFGFSVLGVDPYQNSGGGVLNAQRDPSLKDRVTFARGRAEHLPLPDANIDLIWCRDMLVHLEDLDGEFGECRRVLRPGGRVLILHALACDSFPPTEAAWLWKTMHVVPTTTDPTFFEAAFTSAGFQVVRRQEVGSEWREYREESTGKSRLLHAARMLRQPERYIAEFGKVAYDIMLGDCYWHIYQMLGKLSYWIYVLRS